MRALLVPSILLVSAILAGCTGRDAVNTSTSSLSLPSQAPLEIAGFAANECHGLESVAIWPANTGPTGDEVPPGWEYDTLGEPSTSSHYYVRAYECARFSGGSFERGPVKMLMEAHNQAAFPKDCIAYEGADISNIAVLVAIWIDDPLIAQWMTTTYGIPTRVASFRLDNVTTGGIEQKGWAWKADGQEESSFYLPLVAADNPETTPAYRLMYHDGKTVTGMDWSDKGRATTHYTFTDMYGTFQPPMLYAESGLNQFKGTGDAWVDGSLSTTIQRFGDLECKKPL